MTRYPKPRKKPVVRVEGLGDLTSILSDAFTQSVATITVYTRFSPPYVINTADYTKPADPNAPVNPYEKALQPTIVLDGSIGKQVIAPGGQADPNAWKSNLALVATGVFAGLGSIFYLGYLLGKKRRS